MKPYLVLLRAGPDASALPTLDGLAGQNFDIGLSWAGAAAPDVPGAAFVHASEGARWPGLVQTIVAMSEHIAQYRYVWLPDDTIQAAPGDVARLFAIAEDLQLDLAQPAFTPTSPAQQPAAWWHREFQLRFTDYVDPAAPLFSTALLGAALPTMQNAGSAALLGAVWPRLTRLGKVAIVDATPVERSAVADAAACDDNRISAASHFVTMPQAVAVNYGGLLDNGDGLCLSDRPADVNTLLEALMRSCRTLQIEAGACARYLARHLDAGGSAAVRSALERELAPIGLQFNGAAVPRGMAAALQGDGHPEREAALAAEVLQLQQALAEARRGTSTGAAAQLALREADLRDLRTRHQALVAERDRQAALLAQLHTPTSVPA